MREAALRTLHVLDEVTAHTVEMALQDSNEEVRRAAVQALAAQYRRHATLDTLMKALCDFEDRPRTADSTSIKEHINEWMIVHPCNRR